MLKDGFVLLDVDGALDVDGGPIDSEKDGDVDTGGGSLVGVPRDRDRDGVVRGGAGAATVGVPIDRERLGVVTGGGGTDVEGGPRESESEGVVTGGGGREVDEGPSESDRDGVVTGGGILGVGGAGGEIGVSERVGMGGVDTGGLEGVMLGGVGDTGGGPRVKLSDGMLIGGAAVVEGGAGMLNAVRC